VALRCPWLSNRMIQRLVGVCTRYFRPRMAESKGTSTTWPSPSVTETVVLSPAAGAVAGGCGAVRGGRGCCGAECAGVASRDGGGVAVERASPVDGAGGSRIMAATGGAGGLGLGRDSVGRRRFGFIGGGVASHMAFRRRSASDRCTTVPGRGGRLFEGCGGGIRPSSSEFPESSPKSSSMSLALVLMMRPIEGYCRRIAAGGLM
jgi:hypothetical protein